MSLRFLHISEDHSHLVLKCLEEIIQQCYINNVNDILTQ